MMIIYFIYILSLSLLCSFHTESLKHGAFLAHLSLVFSGTQIFTVSKLRVYTANIKFELIPCRAKAKVI